MSETKLWMSISSPTTTETSPIQGFSSMIVLSGIASVGVSFGATSDANPETRNALVVSRVESSATSTSPEPELPRLEVRDEADEIDELYDRIAERMQRVQVPAEDEPLQALLARLQSLQRAEADAWEATVSRRLSVPVGGLREGIEAARQLLSSSEP